MTTFFSILTLIEAGAIKEDDDVLGMIQGLERDQAEGIADWLALAVQGPVKLEFMAYTHEGPSRITIKRSGPMDVKVGVSTTTPIDPHTKS